MIFPASDETAKDPRPTALYKACASESQANSWTTVNGWAASLVYSRIEEEYEALTESVAVVDFGPLCRYIVGGGDSGSFLARVTTAPLGDLRLGESARGLMLTVTGAVADIVDVTRLGSEMFLLTATRAHGRRLQLAARGLDVRAENITEGVAALALVGPKARSLAASAGVKMGGDGLAAQLTVRGVETAARPITVGAQEGVEIVYPAEEALTLWERMRRAGPPTPAGLRAVEILRIESGAPRPGVDFLYADEVRDLTDSRTPDALGLPHLAPLNRAWFNGRRALTAQSEPSKEVLAVLSIDADALPDKAPVYSAGALVGAATSWAFSPKLKRAIAFAELARTANPADLEVAAGPGEARAEAKLLPTPEEALASAFRSALAQAS